MDRLNIEDGPLLQKYEKLFKGKNIRNLKKLRIQARFFNNSFDKTVLSDQEIIDTGNKDIGAMDFLDMHPRKSCEKGGRQIIIVSEYNLSKDVVPIFEVYINNHQTLERAPSLDRLLVQPSEGSSSIQVR